MFGWMKPVQKVLGAIYDILTPLRKKGWIDKTGQVNRPDNSTPPR